jgi:hypothetical protein
VLWALRALDCVLLAVLLSVFTLVVDCGIFATDAPAHCSQWARDARREAPARLGAWTRAPCTNRRPWGTYVHLR